MSDGPIVDKRELVAILRAQMSAEIDEMTRIAREAAQAATHEENKPEGDKDMRSTEASYIARGQAERVRDLERALVQLGGMLVTRFDADAAIELSALVEVRFGNKTATYFIVEAGGGRRVQIAGIEIQSITTTSPIGSALLGLSAGDEAEIVTPQGTRTYEIVRVF